MSLNFPRIPVHESRDKKLLGAAAPGQEKKFALVVRARCQKKKELII